MPADEQDLDHDAGRRPTTNRWSSLSVRTKAGVLVVLLLLAFLALAALVGVTTTVDHRAQANVSHALAVQAQLDRVLQLSVEAETGVRSYALTRQATFLDPYQSARAQLPIAIDRLDTLVGENPAQRPRLDQVRSLSDQRIALSGQIISVVNGTAPPSTPPLGSLLALGKSTTDDMRAEVEAMNETENGLLATRRAHADSVDRLTALVFGISAAIGLVLALAVMVAFSRGVVRRIEQLERNAAHMEKGEPLEPLLPGNDELSRLGRRMEETAGLLTLRETDLRERQALLQAVVRASPDLIAIFGNDGTLQWASDAFSSVAGYTVEEWQSRPPTEIVHAYDAKIFGHAMRRVLAGRDDSMSVRIRIRHGGDGRWVTLEGRGRALDGIGDETRLLIVARDVTERAQLEQALHDAKNTAESANQAKSEFLSRMSHELRTPLNAVLGFAQVLELDSISARQHEAVDQILHGGRHLLGLINEILDISRIEAGHVAMSPEPVLVSQLVQETVDLIAPLAAHHDVSLSGHTSPACAVYVLADRQRLKQIVLNLLSNAVKYNRAGGRISISCLTVAQDRLRIGVTDTGPGIPAENQPMLFTPFERLGAEHTTVEGTGIGLALSRRLAEAMGGTLEMGSTSADGTTFYVELPLAEGPVERYDRLSLSPEPTAIPRPGSAHKVLYVEDNLPNLRLVEHVLATQGGIEIIPAMQGSIGIELAQEHHPDVVLLDLHLPDIDGDEVLRQLRDNPATASIPVIILSADATSGQMHRLLNAGAVAYLTKPLDIRILLDHVGRLLSANTPGPTPR